MSQSERQMVEQVCDVVRDVLADLGGEWGSKEVEQIARGAIKAMDRVANNKQREIQRLESDLKRSERALRDVSLDRDRWKQRAAQAEAAAASLGAKT